MTVMDFFERYLHVTLDGGTGLAELAFLTTIVVCGTAALVYRRVVGAVRRGGSTSRIGSV